MNTLRPSRASDGDAVVDLWRRAVDATHDFLSAEDRRAIDAEVAGFLPQAPLLLAVDAEDRPQGFMLLDGSHMEALFIDPAVHGQGIARLAPALQVEATANDGLVEAARSGHHRFVLGVQWHPEWRVTQTPFYHAIFRAFGQACRQYQQKRLDAR